MGGRGEVEGGGKRDGGGAVGVWRGWVGEGVRGAWREGGKH